MQLPAATSHYSVRVRFGRYLARRLKQAGYGSLASDAAQAIAALKAKGRELEDQDERIQDAMADRDAADDALDLVAREARAALAGRSAFAVREEPFTSIFPDGLGYYTAAPVGEETRRYGELVQRLEAKLDGSDAVRTAVVPKLSAGLQAYDAASRAVADGRTARALADTELDRLTEAFARQMERCYGAVLAELGRSRADAFFLSPSRGRAHPEATPTR